MTALEFIIVLLLNIGDIDMAWPSSSDIDQQYTDEAGDDPTAARAEINKTMGYVNDIIDTRAAANGIASLDSSALIPESQLPINSLFGSSVSGFDRSKGAHLHNNAAVTYAFILSDYVGSSYESVGPTGSGADNIWSAMDNLPSEATHIVCKLITSMQGSTISTTYTQIISARATGGSGAAGSGYTEISYFAFRNTSGSFEEQYINHPFVVIPLDSSLRFDIALLSNADIDGATLHLLGWFQ